MILDGWERSCLHLFNINSEQRRRDAVELVALKKLNIDVLPEGSEPDEDSEPGSEDESDDLDITKPRQFGKQSERARTQTKMFGYVIDSTRIEID